MTKTYLKKIFSHYAGQLFIIGLISLTSCEDKPARLSGGVLPEGELIRGLNYDQHKIFTENIARSSVKTSDATYGIIGTFNDTVFGQSKASFATDFSIGSRVRLGAKVYMPATPTVPHDTVYSGIYYYRFNNNNDTVPNDLWKVDSVMLNLQYQFNDWYGNMTTKQHINVYELTGSLGGNNTAYYSDTEVSYLPMPLGQKMVHPNDDVPDTLKSVKWNNLWENPDSLLNTPQYLWDLEKINAAQDSGWLENGYSAYSARTKYWNIKLSDELAQRIFELDSATLTNTSAFQGIFPGIYVTNDGVISGEGNLTRINLLTTGSTVNTNLTIHLTREYQYMNGEDEVRDTSSNYSYSFPINVENARFNTYEHQKDDRITLEDPTTHSLYVQGMAGVYSNFSLPDEIRFWTDSLTKYEEYKLEGEPYQRASNIEFFLEVDTLSYPTGQGGIKRYPLPDNLTIRSLNAKGELETPTYTRDINGTSVVSAIFGNSTSSSTTTSGNGELVVRRKENEDGTYRYEYLYRFMMKADYFNYILSRLDDKRHEEGWAIDSPEFLAEFKKEFKTEYFIGPSTPTSNFKRVKLFSGSHPTRPLQMNIKYYHYNPR